jgi:hypothetical protein
MFTGFVLVSSEQSFGLFCFESFFEACFDLLGAMNLQAISLVLFRRCETRYIDREFVSEHMLLWTLGVP